jgi:aspartyl/asparaginyl beta-hydroxylase (cupin superfamily)
MLMSYVNKIEENWVDILNEYHSVKNTEEYFEKDLYVGAWDVYPFLFFGDQFRENQEACPKTWDLLKEMPGLTTASFSILRPHTEILEHTGFTSDVLRYHLGLEIPENCSITVSGKQFQWEEGKVFIFDDTEKHSAYNRSDRDRIVLLFDVKKD